MNPVTKILQLTDLHLFGDPERMLVGINPYQTLQRVINKISSTIQQNPPDLILLTGDISQDYSLESYLLVANMLQNLPCPTEITMGNHDYLPIFTKVFGHPAQTITKLSSQTNWRIIVLNSHWPKHVDGRLTNEELTLLHQNLSATPNQPIIIFLHHHVLPIESNWIDKIRLHNDQQFLEIIDQYKNIKAVICGHVHQDTLVIRNEVPFFSTPSTSWQFTNKSPKFKLDTLMPGYRWLDLYEDGTFKTEVVRVDHDDDFVPDINSQGY